MEYADKLKDKNKIVDILIEKVVVSPRKYTEAQAKRDYEHGGGPEAGLEAKISIEVIGRIPMDSNYRSNKDSKDQDAGQCGCQLLFGDCME